MNLETWFSLAGTVAGAAWVALILVPLRFAWPRHLAWGAAGANALLYAALIVGFWSSGRGDFSSLAGVATLFETPGLLLAGWVHYLVFDLLVGTWERGEAHRLGMPQWMLAPALVMTFLLGPIGWLLFLALRLYRSRTGSATTVHP